MALVKTILRNSQRDTIVKWVGSGTDTLTLASLVSYNQTLTSDTATANLLSASVSVSGSGIATVTRNNVDVLNLSGNFKTNIDRALDYIMSENASSDIVVNLTTPGTLIIKVNKILGYTGI
jgi:hypothetical protein